MSIAFQRCAFAQRPVTITGQCRWLVCFAVLLCWLCCALVVDADQPLIPTPASPTVARKAASAMPTVALALIDRDGVTVRVHFQLVDLAGEVPPLQQQRALGGFSSITADSNTTHSSAGSEQLPGLIVKVEVASGLRERDPAHGYAIHIHENPVADDGECTSTGPHLNPTGVDSRACYSSDAPSIFSNANGSNDITSNGQPLANPPGCPCQPGAPLSACETGDLSGKWGMLRVDPSSERNASFPAIWRDATLRLFGAGGVVGRSVALHWPNRTAITCGNIYALDNSSGRPIVPSLPAVAAGTSAASYSVALPSLPALFLAAGLSILVLVSI